MADSPRNQNFASVFPTVNFKKMITRLTKITMVAMVLATTSVSPSCAATQALEGWETYIPHSGQSIFDQISRQEIVKITLVGNMDSLINNRKTRSYSRASFSYKDENGITNNYSVRVRPRGKFRRRVCDFPPLKLKFSKDQLEAAGLSKHNDLKLVSHCMDDVAYNEKLVLREYLAYKLYNELNPNSFRVQLVQITYRDRHDKKNKMTQYGFLIEDVDEMAERMGGKECDDCFALPDELVNTSQEKIASMFQYLIGNTDWNLAMGRNLKLIKMPDGNHTPVPYDFDFSVLVGAPYLRPNSDLSQSPNMERIFLGQSKKFEDLYGTVSYFKTKRKALLGIIRNFHFLNREDRFEAELYIESFFDEMDSRDNAQNMIFGKNEVTGLK